MQQIHKGHYVYLLTDVDSDGEMIVTVYIDRDEAMAEAVDRAVRNYNDMGEAVPTIYTLDGHISHDAILEWHNDDMIDRGRKENLNVIPSRLF